MSRLFGEQLREARQKAGLTQRELAERVQVDHTYLSKIECGKCVPPSVRTLHKIAAVLGADEELLLEWAGKPPVAVLRQRLAKLEAERVELAADVRAMLLQVDLVMVANEHGRSGRAGVELGTLLKMLMIVQRRLEV